MSPPDHSRLESEGSALKSAHETMDRVTEMLTLGRMHHPFRGFLNGAAAIAAAVGLAVLRIANPGEVSLTVAQWA